MSFFAFFAVQVSDLQANSFVLLSTNCVEIPQIVEEKDCPEYRAVTVSKRGSFIFHSSNRLFVYHTAIFNINIINV